MHVYIYSHFVAVSVSLFELHKFLHVPVTTDMPACTGAPSKSLLICGNPGLCILLAKRRLLRFEHCARLEDRPWLAKRPKKGSELCNVS